ncbi:hypothetical protein [Runella rosea]|uniref:hypothetical protein n=1 Tax=Runella rosea TaxID=2259595 RepID=UPI0019652B97|nr:hypothetical protein [Runella rosea]
MTTLLAIWTDKLELTFNELVRPFEFLKILGFTILSLIGMRILVFYFQKKNIKATRTKLKLAMLLTLLISSYLYVDYSIKLVENVIVNRQFRNKIACKIKPSNGLANGTTAENLTIKEYQQIASMNWFPKLPIEATNIMYDYQYDGFLPDYFFSLTYDLPQEMKVDTINYTSGDFTRYQTFKLIDNKKRVTYNEGEH